MSNAEQVFNKSTIIGELKFFLSLHVNLEPYAQVFQKYSLLASHSTKLDLNLSACPTRQQEIQSQTDIIALYTFTVTPESL